MYTAHQFSVNEKLLSMYFDEIQRLVSLILAVEWSQVVRGLQHGKFFGSSRLAPNHNPTAALIPLLLSQALLMSLPLLIGGAAPASLPVGCSTASTT